MHTVILLLYDPYFSCRGTSRNSHDPRMVSKCITKKTPLFCMCVCVFLCIMLRVFLFSNRSEKVQVNGVYLPRENMSLPSNVPLNEHSALCKGKTMLNQICKWIKCTIEQIYFLVNMNERNWAKIQFRTEVNINMEWISSANNPNRYEIRSINRIKESNWWMNLS